MFNLGAAFLRALINDTCCVEAEGLDLGVVGWIGWVNMPFNPILNARATSGFIKL